MKILQILPKIPYPPVDGHNKSMWGVIKYLAERDHDISIICYRQNVNSDCIIEEISKYAKLYIINIATKNNILGALKNLFSEVPYNLSKYNRTEMKDYVINHLRINNYDIIHVTNAHMGWVVDIIKSCCSTPIILRQENLELSIMKRYYQSQKHLLLKFYSFIQYKKFLRYEPKLCSQFEKCIMISPEDEKKLKIFNYKINSTVIPIGVESELFDIPLSLKNNHKIAHIGSLDWYPNRDGLNWFLQNIYSDILKTFPNTQLFLYGNVTENFQINQEVKNNVVIRGFVENIWQEIKDFNLAIVPLRIGSGIRVKILELLAAGINVITTDIGKEGINLVDEKEVLIANNEKDFSQKIIKYFNGFYDALSIAENGRTFIKKNYRWEIIATKFEKTYYELIAK